VEPKITVDSISHDEKRPGWLTVRGTVINGTWDVIVVEARVDSRGWVNASGTVNWTYDIDATRLKDGRHSLEIRAYDGHSYSEVLKKDFTVGGPATEWAPEWPYIAILGWVLFLIMTGLAVYKRRKRKATATQDSANAAEPAIAPSSIQGAETTAAPIIPHPAKEPSSAPETPHGLESAAAPVVSPPASEQSTTQASSHGVESATTPMILHSAEQSAVAPRIFPPYSASRTIPEKPPVGEIPQAKVPSLKEAMETKQGPAMPTTSVRPVAGDTHTTMHAARHATHAPPPQQGTKPRSLEEILTALKGQ
jgi:hypothetical protein